MADATNEDNRYPIFRKLTRSGKVRHYRYRSGWRLVLMSKATAHADVDAGLAVVMNEVPYSISGSDEGWITDDQESA